MGANIAGIYGAQIFRRDDRPRYRRAFSICIAVLAFGLSLAIFRYIDDRIRRRRHARQSVQSSEGGSSEDQRAGDLEKPGATVRSDRSQPEGVVEDLKSNVPTNVA